MVALHPSMLPMTMPPMMPAAIISGTSVVGERRTNYSAIAIAVYWRIIVIVRISAVIGRSIATIVSWCITAVVTVSRAVGVRAGCNAADDGPSNQAARRPGPKPLKPPVSAGAGAAIAVAPTVAAVANANTTFRIGLSSRYDYEHLTKVASK